MYSKTEEEFIQKREALENDQIIANNDTYKNHLVNCYFSRIDKWALYVRTEGEMETHDMNTNNMTETTFRIFKDFILQRHKCYNLPDLVQVILNTGTNFYRLKLTDIGNNRGMVWQSRYKAKDITIRKEQICQIDEDQYRVESESVKGTFYYVSMKSGFCECLQGRNCGPCKHKFAIAHHFGVSGASCLPQLDNQSRARWHFIATGQEVDPSWFRGLRDTETQQPAPEPTQEPEQTSDLEETQNENEMDVVVNQDANDLDDDAQNHENRNDDDMNVDWDNDHANFKNINEQFMAAARQGYEAKDKGFIRAIRNFYKRLKIDCQIGKL